MSSNRRIEGSVATALAVALLMVMGSTTNVTEAAVARRVPVVRRVEGAITPGEVGVHRIRARSGQVLVVALHETGVPGVRVGEFGDPVLGVFPPNPTLDKDGRRIPYITNDDSGTGYLPQLAVPIDQSGRWTVEVTGSGDRDFDGAGHSEHLRYRLELAVVQEPIKIDESEPNGASGDRVPMRKSDRVLRGSTGAAVVRGSLTPGDLDRFSVHVPSGASLAATLFDGEGGEFNDSVIRLEDSGGELLATNDDVRPGFLSALRFENEDRGRSLDVVISGFEAGGTAHRESFSYVLLLSVVD